MPVEIAPDDDIAPAEIPRPEGCVVWLLCETASEASPAPAVAQALSRRLGMPVKALVTAIDTAPLVPSVAEKVLRHPAPQDNERANLRFLDHWTPDFGIVIGRPPLKRLIEQAASRDIPLFWAAASRTATSPSQRGPGYMERFHTLFAPSASEANALRLHLRDPARRIEISGPLSDTVFALPCNEAECDDLAKLLGGRPVWLAAEVEREEVGVMEAAHRKAFRSAHRLLLIIVPRKMEAADGIVADLEANGWRVSRRSHQGEPDPETQIYVADTEDELGLWYRLAPASFVGGTLQAGSVPTDPYAPAALGSAVLHGPNTGENPARFKALAAHGASLPIGDAEELAAAVISLLAPDKAASLAQAAWATTTESAHVVERMADVMFEILEARERTG